MDTHVFIRFAFIWLCPVGLFAQCGCGSGEGLLLLPVLGSLLSGAQIPAALSIGTVSSSISRIIAFWFRIRWDVVVWFVPAALPAVYVGARLLTYINPLYLELLMGVFLMANRRGGNDLFLEHEMVTTPPERKPLPMGWLRGYGGFWLKFIH